MQESSAVRNSAPEEQIQGRLVRHLDDLDWHPRGRSRWACAFASGQGTEKLSLHVLEVSNETLSVPPQRKSETVLYVMAGSGMISIAGRGFSVSEGDGVYVRMAESMMLSPDNDQCLRLVMAICPASDSPWEGNDEAPEAVTEAFDEKYPTRIVSVGNAAKEATGDRYFKVLVGPKTGSTAVTQFIGSIPRSRAPEHFHRYEEVICVLSGEGRIHMGESSTPVRAGSLIFLPRKQPHCMECTVDDGIELLGMFYPAGSPAINYSSERRKET